jgi:hypothetical protein
MGRLYTLQRRDRAVVLTKAATGTMVTNRGIVFRLNHCHQWEALYKAARRSTLEEGATKERNGVTYRLNKNRRWERSDRGSKPAKSRKSKLPGGVVPVVAIDGAKAKGKPKAMRFDSRPPNVGAKAVQQGKLSIKAQRAVQPRPQTQVQALAQPQQPVPTLENLHALHQQVAQPHNKNKSKKKTGKKEAKKVGGTKPTLKAVDWNPDAIPDLSAKDFRKHLFLKQKIAYQFSPDEVWNKSRKESGLSTAWYRNEIANAINDGFVPSDKAIADAKLTKAQFAKVEANRKEQASWSDQVARIDKAINAPMADDKANRDWKSRMSDEEASDYLKDSYFGQMAWFHGNSKDVTDSIANEGAMPERNSRGIYGQGVYFGIDRRIGEQYAGAVNVGLDVGILTSHIRAKKPYITNSKDLADIGKNFPGDQSNFVDSVALSQFLRAKGYDAVYLQDLGYGIAFDKKQVVTVKDEDATEARERRRDLTRQRQAASGTKPHDDWEEWAEENPNGRLLGKLSRSEESVDYVGQWTEDDNYKPL